MKKKIILGLLLFLMVLLFNPPSVSAACRIKPLLGCDAGHPNLCGDGNNCCTTPSECSAYPAPPTSPSCGGQGQVCCTGQGQTACDNSGGGNLSCIAGRCTPGNACGNAGQACCSGSCNSGLQCINGSCGAVGVPAANGGVVPGAELCGDGIDTAIGCIPVLADDNGVSFMGFILRWAVGIGGGIAFVLILYGSFMVMTSQANPERIKAGHELLGSAISGLILLLLSIFLLEFIGVDILGLNDFGFAT